MKDAKGHGSNPRGGPTSPRAERTFLNRQLDQRKVMPPAQRPWGPARSEHVSQRLAGLGVSAETIRAAVEQQTIGSGEHSRGVHSATIGKTLAETSAMGAVPQSQAKVGGNS